MTTTSSPTGPRWVRSATLGLAFRPIVEDDATVLRQIFASTREDELAALPLPPQQKAALLAMQFQAQDAHYRLHHPDMDRLLVSAGEAAVGRLYLDRGARELQLVDISLLPAYRGRSFGSAILHDILSEAAATGRPVTLHVVATNPAMRLYTRLGFILTEDLGLYVAMRWTPDQAAAAS